MTSATGSLLVKPRHLKRNRWQSKGRKPFVDRNEIYLMHRRFNFQWFLVSSLVLGVGVVGFGVDVGVGVGVGEDGS